MELAIGLTRGVRVKWIGIYPISTLGQLRVTGALLYRTGAFKATGQAWIH